jgi:hypothetical protein
MARTPLVVVPPGATAEEVAAVVATLAALAEDRRQAVGAEAPPADPGERLDAWVRAARLSGRRAGMTRGPWRLSARVARRSRT